MAARQTDPAADDSLARALAEVERGFAMHRSVRCSLPREGRLLIERPLPHLLFHRRSAQTPDNTADRLVTPLPPYLIAGVGQDEADLAKGLRTLVQLLSAHCGRVLVIEIAEEPVERPGGLVTAQARQIDAPHFRMVVADDPRFADVVTELGAQLEKIEISGQKSRVSVARTLRDDFAAYDLLTELAERCFWLRLEVRPIYREPMRLYCYPAVLSELQCGLYEALLATLHRFAVTHSSFRAERRAELGRTTLERAARDVDGTLVGVSARLSFLLNLAPANMNEAWEEFRDSGFERAPSFQYRPLMLDPLELKRALFAAPFELVEDPVVARLLRALVEEYDGLLGMLEVRGTPDFLSRSKRAFGVPDDELARLATTVLAHYADPAPRGGSSVNALELAERARSRMEAYRRLDETFPCGVELRDDVAAGLMVDKGCLLIHPKLVVSSLRAEALLAHEIDTHVVTYHNGSAQPLRVLGSGLAHYEATQEGLAVLAEYLVGGLTPQRMRILAARVLAVRELVQGADFVDVFRALHRNYHFGARNAFDVALRVFRGGGLTKDAVYLHGLNRILHYMRHGGDLHALYVGKISLDQWSDVDALVDRGILRAPKLAPRWLGRKDVQERILQLTRGVSIFDMGSKVDSPPDSKREP